MAERTPLEILTDVEDAIRKARQVARCEHIPLALDQSHADAVDAVCDAIEECRAALEQGTGEEAVERVAKWLHDEGWARTCDAFPDCSTADRYRRDARRLLSEIGGQP